MDDTPLSVLITALVFLIFLSAFFSGSETGLMTLNRYRLRHLADKQHPGAVRAQRLLQRQDRLIGLILLGNNFVNVLASILMTLITLRIYNDTGLLFAAGLILTIVILLFAEVTPKTLAALHPESIAFPAAFVYVPLLKLMSPLVWVVNGIATVTNAQSDNTFSTLSCGVSVASQCCDCAHTCVSTPTRVRIAAIARCR